MLNKLFHTISISILFSCWITPSFAQHSNELYVNGALLYTSSTSEMYVLGDVHVVSTSEFQHNGLLEVQGNMYGSNTMRQTGTGTVRLHNRTVNIGEVQTIYSTDGFAVRGGYATIGSWLDGSFYNLELANDQGTVYLSGSSYGADVRNSVNFNPGLGSPTNRIITCNPPPSAVPADGPAYTSIFGIMNLSTALSTVMVNNTVSTNGNSSSIDNGYVQGKLRRAIDPAGGIYGFVLGLEPTAAGPTQRGMQYSQINFAANDYDVVTGYFDSGFDNTVSGYQLECSGYEIDYYGGVDHGQWVFLQLGGNTGTYEMTVWPQNDNFTPQTVWLVTKDNIIDGTTDDCGASPVGLSRDGFNGFSVFGVAGGSSALPIELLDINATPINQHTIRINWSTATETNVSHFEIERSIDGINFSSIGTTTTDGNSVSVRNYDFDDVNCIPEQIYYYRIRTVDNDNSSQITIIVSAKTISEDNTISSINVFPNPFGGTNFSINLYSSLKQTIRTTIYNNIGQIIYDQPASVIEGQNSFSIEVPDLSNGLYFIEIEEQNQLQPARFKLIKY